jgi:aminopeptidase N
MRRWAIEQSPQGPVYLGYRLGHIRGDSRVFRALVYNKGAMVLHMLRRLVGDEVFFDGLREYYSEWRFKKAGTDDFRVVMESVSGQSLDTFFDGWIYGSAIPSLSFSSAVTGSQAVVRFEHQTAVVPTPVTVTILYADGRSEDVVVRVTRSVVEQTLELSGRVRSIVANRDHGSLAVIRE